ncbi:MAG: (2Fe-2S)-binding protein [Gammaproteobacteria bacterium]|nr:(2Fe-2S)-binding protein [Gammaproteobacteria bacterium]
MGLYSYFIGSAIYPIMDGIDNHSHLHYLYSMFVCICKQVTDRHIEEAVNNGASSFSDVQSELGVATQCGECKNHARQCMRNCRSQCQSNAISDNNLPKEFVVNLV